MARRGLGVFWDEKRRKWVAQLTIYIGAFDTIPEAQAARDEFRASSEWLAAKRSRKWLVGRGGKREAH